MHARHVRAKPMSARLKEDIQGPGWEGLARAFERTRGVELKSFPMHDDLLLLSKLCSVIRNGDGPAAKVFISTSRHYFLRMRSILVILTGLLFGGAETSSVRKLDTSAERLKAFIDAVAGFCDEIAQVRRPSGS